MIADNAKDALVVVAGLQWAEVNDDALRGVGLDRSNLLAEAKHVVGVRNKLELGGEIASVHNVQNTIGLCFNLNLTEVHRFCAQVDIVSLGLSLATKCKFIAPCAGHTEVRGRKNVTDCRRERYSYCGCGAWHKIGAHVRKLQTFVLTVVRDPLDLD